MYAFPQIRCNDMQYNGGILAFSLMPEGYWNNSVLKAQYQCESWQAVRLLDTKTWEPIAELAHSDSPSEKAGVLFQEVELRAISGNYPPLLSVLSTRHSPRSIRDYLPCTT